MVLIVTTFKVFEHLQLLFLHSCLCMCQDEALHSSESVSEVMLVLKVKASSSETEFLLFLKAVISS